MKLTLAIVDDNLDVRRAIVRLLRSYGHDVHAFASAEAYLAVNCAVDCAILDIELPGLSGLELQEQMVRTGRRVPVVFITAHQSLADLHEHFGAPFLTKPFDGGQLIDAIARVTTD